MTSAAAREVLAPGSPGPLDFGPRRAVLPSQQGDFNGARRAKKRPGRQETKTARRQDEATIGICHAPGRGAANCFQTQEQVGKIMDKIHHFIRSNSTTSDSELVGLMRSEL